MGPIPSKMRSHWTCHAARKEIRMALCTSTSRSAHHPLPATKRFSYLLEQAVLSLIHTIAVQSSQHQEALPQYPLELSDVSAPAASPAYGFETVASPEPSLELNPPSLFSTPASDTLDLDPRLRDYTPSSVALLDPDKTVKDEFFSIIPHVAGSEEGPPSPSLMHDIRQTNIPVTNDVEDPPLLGSQGAPNAMAEMNATTAHNLLCTELAKIQSPNLEGNINYDHRRRKGRGSFGDVYMGKRVGTATGDFVCVKELSTVVTISESGPWKRFLRLLKREVKIWHGLEHRNVVKFIGWTSKVCEDTLTVCLISAWCSDGNVKEYLAKQTDADRRGLVYDVSQGLVYLHSQGVIHGDIKPANIVVSTETKAVARLCDFGLSSILDDATTRAHTSTIAGTPRYASPELFSVISIERNEASDIWAFGCTATEILTNKPPFHWIKRDIQIPSVIDTQLPYAGMDQDDFGMVLSLCFEREPEKRPDILELTWRLRRVYPLNRY
ncbi:kinase-like domain-containing protein [Cantharellus anzutake]|uniref:kinase-like domain-containing protein n=1 Tax=Cantharellus anzutake TaxID=1750568 RepID=UPI001902F9D5|nr:kinase-like domain-containing protein [Cantharellus anzutake]KAF8338025.1 kinase-like domain-containing protein [Cantharellus anzutake]